MESKIEITVVFNKGEKVLPLQLNGETSVSTLKRLVASELHVPVSDQKVFYKGSVLMDTKTIKESGIKDKDIIEVQGVSLSQSLTSLRQIPQHIWQNPAQLQETIKGNPKLLNQLLHQNPTLATAVMSNNTFMLEQYFIEQRRAREATKRKEDMEISRLQANPLDPESQRRIQEIIREKNIRENMEKAIEHNPEAFGSVIMLYIPCAVNKVPLKAFVDSGAQMTIMSQKCAEKVGLAHLIDKRWQGMAKGVGTSKITGRIHAAQIQIGSAFLTMSITILENQDMDFLLGLDQLRRHQACIDLKDNCLRIQGQNVKFLSEKDIPKNGIFQDGKGQRSVGSGSSSSSRSSSQQQQGSNSDGKNSAAAGPRGKKQKVEGSSSSGMEMESSSSPSATLNPQAATEATTVSEGISATSLHSSSRSASSTVNQQPQHLATLMSMGFSSAMALEALQVCGGNVELAASYLFSRQ